MSKFRVTTTRERRYEQVIDAKDEYEALEAARITAPGDLLAFDTYTRVVPFPADSEEEQAK